MIDAIFSRDEDQRLYEVTAYNYNADSDAKSEEPLVVRAKLPVAANTKFKYRLGKFGKDGMKLKWSEWDTATTSPSANPEDSLVTLREKIEGFSYLKYEIITE
jgi:hypothetical protein